MKKTINNNVTVQEEMKLKRAVVNFNQSIAILGKESFDASKEVIAQFCTKVRDIAVKMWGNVTDSEGIVRKALAHVKALIGNVCSRIWDAITGFFNGLLGKKAVV